MSKESKTRLDQPLIGALKHFQLREATASVKLDGDTMDCTKCKAAQRQKFIGEIACFLHGEISKEKLAEKAGAKGNRY